jgi:uncharacterized membrane protein (TIGR02234 family)
VVAVLGAVASVTAAVSALLARGDAAAAAGRLLGGAPDSTSTTAWPWAVAAGCLVSAAAFAVAFARAGSWPEMSSRYDAPGDHGTHGAHAPAAGADADEQPSGAALWKAIDEGTDPTV